MTNQPDRSNSIPYAACVVVAALLLCQVSAKGDEAQFIYDELGRLSQVIDEKVNVATYTYDAVGNLLSITRSRGGVPGPTITSISPLNGSVGDTVPVTVTGDNLDGATLTTDNPGITVSGVSTAPTSISATFTIDAAARSGPTTVTATSPLGVDSTTFTVNPTIVSLNPDTGVPTRLVTITAGGPVFSPTPTL